LNSRSTTDDKQKQPAVRTKMVSFKAKPFKNGKSWAITIPSAYVKQGLVDPSKTLKLEVEVTE
jgi:hypothetical protein